MEHIRKRLRRAARWQGYQVFRDGADLILVDRRSNSVGHRGSAEELLAWLIDDSEVR